MSEFEVGQKVKHFDRGDVEITHGPFTGVFGDLRYLVRQGSGREVVVSPESLVAVPKPPKFAVGDVTSNHAGTRRYTIEGGPFSDGVREWYAAKNPEGQTHKVHADDLSETVQSGPIKVGDRVRVTDDDGGGRFRFNGRIGTIVKVHTAPSYLPYLVAFGDGHGDHGDENGRWNCKAVERVTDEDTHTHEGVTYDLTARYRDRDGDYWTFKAVDGTVRGNCAGTNVATDVHHWCDSLGNAVRKYGPLTRVSD
ncbi:phiSA1p31-related protein [Streptomyces sp. NPDC096057]|uniref:phiSA1p31-related protein n=1 Tax=Streptomyces sp. NPDC096057 TaxID=3155543 RepID=UPI00331B105D